MATIEIFRPDGRYSVPKEPAKVGPRNEAERRLFALIQEGLDSGPAEELDEGFFDALKNRIRAINQSKRA